MHEPHLMLWATRISGRNLPCLWDQRRHDAGEESMTCAWQQNIIHGNMRITVSQIIRPGVQVQYGITARPI